MKRILLIINLCLLLSCSRQKIEDVEADGSETSKVNQEETDVVSHDVSRTVECKENGSSAVDESNRDCQPGYQAISNEEACTNIPGYSWSEAKEACFPEYDTITSKQECEKDENNIWGDANMACYPEYASITSEEKCSSIDGYSWSTEHKACYPSYSNISSAEKCNSIGGYSWSTQHKACYPNYSNISSAEQCNSINGYSWNSSEQKCLEDFETLSAEESCKKLPQYIWDQNQCVLRLGSTKSFPAESCKAILDSQFSIGDGVYWLDPNHSDSADAFEAYCDMTKDGGGWTLIASTNGNDASMPMGNLKSPSQAGIFNQNRTIDLGNRSTQVRISNLTGWKVISIANTFPINQVRVYKRLHDNVSKDNPRMYWTGSTDLLTHAGVQEENGIYLNEMIYQTNSSPDGLHISAKRNWSLFWNKPTENFNLWVR